MPFMDFQENMEVQEQLIFYVIQEVLRLRKQELEILERNIDALERIQLPFPRKTHAEVVKELQAMGSDIEDGADLG